MSDAITQIPSALAPPAPAPSRLLATQLQALKHRQLTVAILTGLALALAVSIELLAVALFLDWWLELPRAIRAVLLLLQAAVLGAILARQVLLPLLRQPTEDALALTVEKALPQFQSRLIASIQLTRPNGLAPNTSTALVQTLVEQTEALATAHSQAFRFIVSTERLRNLGLLAASVACLALGGLYLGRDVCGALLQRAFLSNTPVPRKTRVLIPDGNKIIGRGDDVRLEAYAEGILPAEGKLVVQYPNRRSLEYSLEQNQDNPAHFGRTIQNVQDSFTYTVYLNDGASSPCQVKTIPRPTVDRIECQQDFPDYAQLPSQPRPAGDLVLLAGSQLRLTVTATKDLQQAAIRLVGPEQILPLQRDPANPRLLTGAFTVPKTNLTGFSILMRDTENMDSRDTTVYRVEILPDKPPKAKITFPERKEELVTRLATLLIGMELADDFLISKVRLHYKVDTLGDGAEKSFELDPGNAPVSKLQRAFPWKLAETFNPPLTEGSIIEFWIEAVDNNTATGPGVGATDHHMARVVSREEKLADALNRASDSLSGIEDMADDQTKANRNLGAIILQKTNAP